MDIHLTASEPTAEERAALDSELGPGDRRGRSHRHLLLPALHAIQARIGWISPGALNYVCVRLDVPPAEAHGVASLRDVLARAPSARGGARLR